MNISAKKYFPIMQLAFSFSLKWCPFPSLPIQGIWYTSVIYWKLYWKIYWNWKVSYCFKKSTFFLFCNKCFIHVRKQERSFSKIFIPWDIEWSVSFVIKKRLLLLNVLQAQSWGVQILPPTYHYFKLSSL